MKCYQTRYEDGVFTGVTYAEPDPLEPERMVMPGACLALPPPAYVGGLQARWDGEVWVIEDAPAATGLRDGVVYGVQIAWDGEDFTGVLVSSPFGDDPATWNGKAWARIAVPVPHISTPAEKLAALGLTIDDLIALGVKVA